MNEAIFFHLFTKSKQDVRACMVFYRYAVDSVYEIVWRKENETQRHTRCISCIVQATSGLDTKIKKTTNRNLRVSVLFVRFILNQKNHNAAEGKHA